MLSFDMLDIQQNYVHRALYIHEAFEPMTVNLVTITKFSVCEINILNKNLITT